MCARVCVCVVLGYFAERCVFVCVRVGACLTGGGDETSVSVSGGMIEATHNPPVSVAPPVASAAALRAFSAAFRSAVSVHNNDNNIIRRQQHTHVRQPGGHDAAPTHTKKQHTNTCARSREGVRRSSRKLTVWLWLWV